MYNKNKKYCEFEIDAILQFLHTYPYLDKSFYKFNRLNNKKPKKRPHNMTFKNNIMSKRRTQKRYA